MKTKLAIFDFDGTLTKSRSGGNCWRYVWQKINKTDVDDKLFHMFLSNQISYEKHGRLTLQEFIESNVDDNLLKEIASEIKTVEGIKETFTYLSSNNVKVFVLSGGIKQMISYILEDSLPYIENIEAESLKYNEEGNLEDIIFLKHDINTKSEYINYLLNKYHVEKDEAVFVGNAFNDHSAKETGIKTICVNPDRTDPYDKRYWDHYVKNIENLQEILPFIE